MNLIELDQQLFQFVNNFAGQSALFDNIVRATVNEYFIPTLLSLILFGLWFYWSDSKSRDLNQKSVVLAILAVGFGSIVIVSILNNLFERPRPFETLDVNLLFYKPTDPSFPSNSAVIAFSLASSIFLANKRVGIAAFLVAAFYGFVRVFAGVHFPLDVLTGALIGILSVGLVNMFQSYLTQFVVIVRNLLKGLNLEEFA